MSKFVKKQFKCPYCNNSFEDFDVSSMFLNNDAIDLDTNPNNDMDFYDVHYCNNCNGIIFNFDDLNDKNLDEEIRNSSQLKAIANDDEIPEIPKKYILAGIILSKDKKFDKSGKMFLKAYWYLKKHDGNTNLKQEVLDKAIDNFSYFLEDNVSIDTAMILIDLLRQQQSFDDAKETLDSLLEFIKKTNRLNQRQKEIYENILKFEDELIKNKDFLDHKISEVKSYEV